MRRLYIGLLVSLLGSALLLQYHYAEFDSEFFVGAAEARHTARRATESQGVELAISNLHFRGPPASYRTVIQQRVDRRKSGFELILIWHVLPEVHLPPLARTSMTPPLLPPLARTSMH